MNTHDTAAEVRAWAKAVGVPVSDTGRIPVGVRRAWQDARAARDDAER